MTTVFLLGNGLTALSYLVIAFLLLSVHRKRPDLSISAFSYMFAAFISTCGIGHAIFLITLWEPIYLFEAWWSVLVAALSVATTALMVKALPQILRLVSVADLQDGISRAAQAAKQADEATKKAEALATELDKLQEK